MAKTQKSQFTSPTHLSDHFLASRDSSVGRASDWRSEGPWFNPGSRHIFKCQKSKPQVMLKRILVPFSRGITKTPLATVATMFWKLENPGIDPGASRMQIERSTTWANPPCEFCVFWTMWWREYGRFRNFVSDFRHTLKTISKRSNKSLFTFYYCDLR